jgi:hypothetical protein
MNIHVSHSSRRLVLTGLRFTLLVAWILLFTTRDASAYIDPSAGGMLVQLLLAGTAGVAVLGKLFWSRITHFFGASKPHAPSEPARTGSDQPNDRV